MGGAPGTRPTPQARGDQRRATAPLYHPSRRGAVSRRVGPTYLRLCSRGGIARATSATAKRPRRGARDTGRVFGTRLHAARGGALPENAPYSATSLNRSMVWRACSPRRQCNPSTTRLVALYVRDQSARLTAPVSGATALGHTGKRWYGSSARSGAVGAVIGPSSCRSGDEAGVLQLR